jgi:DNA-binding NtrC family response regulator
MEMDDDQANILVIDDDEDILKMLTDLLSKGGYATDTARTGAEAIEKMKARSFNIALVDIVLPDIRGTRLLPLIKEITPNIRKIIITGHATLESAIEALNAGSDAYITKPFDPPQLLKVIAEKLRDQREEQHALNLLYEALKVLEPKHTIRTETSNKKQQP